MAVNSRRTCKAFGTRQARIAQALAGAGRDAAAVRLLAVSKTFPAAAVRGSLAAGQREFGENYVQEALDKQRALSDLPLEWHFIGPIQSNKTRAIAENFSWVHSVDRLKIAERLSAQRPAGLPPLQVCIELNVSGEASKGGVAPAELPALADAVAASAGAAAAWPDGDPAPAADLAAQRRRFGRCAWLRDRSLAATGSARHPVDGHVGRSRGGGRRGQHPCPRGHGHLRRARRALTRAPARPLR